MTDELRAKIAELRRLQACWLSNRENASVYLIALMEMAVPLADALEASEREVERLRKQINDAKDQYEL